MAIYAYIYSGFPDRKARKYYVCNYRKGNAYTYQVVPQLQREFDRKDYDDKTRIGWKRFKKLRKDGHLYTSNRDHKRTPLYGEAEDSEAEGRKTEDGWQFLAEWLGGEVWPGEVDWSEFGKRLRERLELACPLPESIRELADHVVVTDGEPWPERYEKLRKRHLDETWYHLIGHCRPADIAEADGRDWEPSGPADEMRADGGERRFHDRIRETRRMAPPLDESECLAQFGEVAGEAGPENWSALMEALGSRESWYETVEAGADGAIRVPAERLYEVQWRLAGRLRAMGLHHACAPAGELDHPGPLHARFHAGARQAVVVRLAEYPPPVDRAELSEQLRLQTHGGALDGWSEAGVEALAQLLVDPETGRPPPAAPTSETVAEFVAWEVDEAIRRLADERLPDGRRWQYSRLRDEIVLSAPAGVEADALSTAREVIGEGLEARGWREMAGETRLWRADEPLVIGGAEVPSEADGRLRIPGERRSRVETALERARDGEVRDEDRAVLMMAYRVTGDVRYRATVEEGFREDVRGLVRAVTLSDFEDEAWSGWSLGGG